jgi:AraC family transcriptional regulator of adaptative response/methylated-DNA-[protein]-cysteine methyltransferase
MVWKIGVKPSALFRLKVHHEPRAYAWVYDILYTPVGILLVAGAAPSVSYVAFCTEESAGVVLLASRFPEATVARKPGVFYVLHGLLSGAPLSEPITLEVRGTAFQQKVWEQLMEIPLGSFVSYGEIAAAIDQPGASRAVGTAVGRNPIAYFIPCHRVLASGGGIGGYYWGVEVKERLMEWEVGH